jgi:hypothetical protein
MLGDPFAFTLTFDTRLPVNSNQFGFNDQGSVVLKLGTETIATPVTASAFIVNSAPSDRDLLLLQFIPVRQTPFTSPDIPIIVTLRGLDPFGNLLDKERLPLDLAGMFRAAPELTFFIFDYQTEEPIASGTPLRITSTSGASSITTGGLRRAFSCSFRRTRLSL